MERIDPPTFSLVCTAILAIFLIAAVVLRRRRVLTALQGKRPLPLVFHRSGEHAFREERAAHRREQRAEERRKGQW
jgi:hypothetical protein